MSERPNLSSTATGARWLDQFPPGDQARAAELLDYLLLISESEVSRQIHLGLRDMLPAKGRVALYAERELAEKTVFPIERYVDSRGIARSRAVGSARFPAIRPTRGATRVGSEGWMAFLISQAVDAEPRFVNSPSPSQYRSANIDKRIHDIVIVTDFIASGDRIYSLLNGFWRLPTFRAWWSRKWVRFHVVAAVTTGRGRERVLSHPCGPAVHAPMVSPVLTEAPVVRATQWKKLAIDNGPDDEPLGYGSTGALLSFEYGFPNNVPAIFRRQYRVGGEKRRWRPLFKGRSPPDLREAFTGQPGSTVLLMRLGVQGFQKLREALDGRRRRATRIRNLAFLAALRGRWHKDSEIEVAARSGLTVLDVLTARKDAIDSGWVNAEGRLTDPGRRVMKAAKRVAPAKRQVATQPEPYYPKALRVP
jgi:hypothetical protein